jgi:hypothetical protein
VQQEILAKNPSANVVVDVIWFNMLPGDSRQAWTGDGMSDPRVRHFWDEQKAVGNWFTANVTHARGTTWDFYALYGPEAHDLGAPSSMGGGAQGGGTIIGHRDQLAAAVAQVLGVQPTP